VVETFLSRHQEFEPVDLRTEPAAPPPLLDDRGRLRTLPSVHALEAFFAAVLVRR
jgi:16S rRNA C967 or C1407 C5-methylase (RsmB/RsmF family)